MSATPITITAEILPGKQDPSAEAHFANGQRASQYARMLVDSGDYTGVYLDDGVTKWPIRPSA
ncbi:hypothetical protein [Mycobacterium sp. 48b]|uniref:hypothetical protein n=1 Tax=Mycobacterium sp. 48b TaxID=3400426 RepID=UPI003AAD9CD0